MFCRAYMEIYLKWVKSREKNKEITKPILAHSKARRRRREAQSNLHNQADAPEEHALGLKGR
jgi:putative ubiquitin-RnfH superfamily antitoxin RatB of RatAB toxin-antitoxin module